MALNTVNDAVPAFAEDKSLRAGSDEKITMQSPAPPSPNQSRSSPFALSSIVASCIFLSANLLASVYSPIQDCDEVFNYWEPTHYIVHGFGLQTWEYSPEYAIRSWLYTLIHAMPSKVAATFVSGKALEFYIVRGFLGLVCAGCETRLFAIISRTMNPRIAMFFLLIMVSSSGMFHASVAFLPSSFAMYTAMMGAAAFMSLQDGLKTTEGIMWFGIGATIGWPFSAALILPFSLDELMYLKQTADIKGVASRILGGTLRLLAIVVSTTPPFPPREIPRQKHVLINIVSPSGC